MGTDVYLQKPFDLDELLSVVRNLLSPRRRRTPARTPEPAPAAAKSTFQFAGGRVDVNFDTYQVAVGGNSIRLTALEMKLLRYFIEHEGFVVTRAELLESVWGMSHSPTTPHGRQLHRQPAKVF